MRDEYFLKIAKLSKGILYGTGEDAHEFADSPTYALSKMPRDERIYILIYLEAVIAIENSSEEYFDIDYIMALNEYLVRRTGLSVRMLNLWITGKNFKSLRDVTTYLNERYRTTVEFMRNNEVHCRRMLKTSGIQCERIWKRAVQVFDETPEELLSYDEKLGSIAFRENPVGFLLSLREEERLKYIALLAEVLYEHVHHDPKEQGEKQTKTCRKFVGEFGNLINTYIKYPEDPEIQTLLLTVRMSMNDEDFKDDIKRRNFFNDHLRLAAYYWNTNQRGCRKSIISKWDEYGELFKNMPADRTEPSVRELFLDEAVLNIPEFQNDALKFLHFQMTSEQCCHFLTMLEATTRNPEDAALAGYVSMRFLQDPSSETAADLDEFFGWKDISEEERIYQLAQNLWDLVAVWRYNYKNCRKKVKTEWEQYEISYQHVAAPLQVPENLSDFASLLEDQRLQEDPFGALEKFSKEKREEFIVFCGALHGFTDKNAALNAQSMVTWMENSANQSAMHMIDRINGWKSTGTYQFTDNIRGFFRKAAMNWRFNYRGLRESAVAGEERYRQKLEDLIKSSKALDIEEELRIYHHIMGEEKYYENPCEYLRRMSYVQCTRFLLLTAVTCGMKTEEAMLFAQLITNVILYPNKSLRRRTDSLIGRQAKDDQKRYENINELLKGTVLTYEKEQVSELLSDTGRKKFETVFEEYRTKSKANTWELNEQNVNKLFRYCILDRTAERRIGEDDPDALVVNLYAGTEQTNEDGKKLVMNEEHLLSDRTQESLRSMLGQLDVFFVRDERVGRAVFALEDLIYKRNSYGEQEKWTSSKRVILRLLYMGVGAEIFGHIHTENCKDEEVVMTLDLHEKGAKYIETISGI